MKSTYVSNLQGGNKVKSSFMVFKIIAYEDNNVIAFIGDKTGEIKASIPDKSRKIEVGNVISVSGKFTGTLIGDKYEKVKDYDIFEYLSSVKRPIKEIMDELQQLSDENFKSKEVIALNEYFFNNDDFLDKFMHGIGGLKQHHNYLGGLAEHSLNVMYLAKVYAERYNCKHKEIAILAAKLHDIGKIKEYPVNGPFSTSTEGEMEGHIVIGVEMLNEAFREGGDIYSEDFKIRMKGCIIQHHGKLEYGSPKTPKSQEAYIVHLADYVDAIMNKVEQIVEGTEAGKWSEYDRRIGSRIYS